MSFSIALVRSLSCLALVGGCVDDNRDVGVGDLSADNGYLSIVAGRDYVSVEFQYLVADRTACTRLAHDVKGMVGEVLLENDRGGAAEVDGFTECQTPSMRMTDLPAFDNAVLVLFDSETSVTCNLGDALVDRGPKLMTPGEWRFTPGQQVTVRWWPASDFDGRYNFYVLLVPPDGRLEKALRVESTTDASGRVTLTIPATAPPGPHQLRFAIYSDTSGRPIEPDCGPLEATMFVSEDVDQPIVIAP